MYAVLHPPNFSAQAAAHERPELRKRPFALLDGEPPTETVIAANKAARSLGVEVGMTRLQSESFPGVVSVPRTPEHEISAHATLHTIACMFSPRIEYVEEHPGTYALDIQGMNSLFGDDAQLGSKLRQRIMAAGFLTNVGVAQNFHAAVCLAYGRNGVSVVPPGCEAEAIGQLPLRVLNLAPEHKEIFQSWGIRTCAELTALSETDLIARIGQTGKRLHSLARGEWPHLMIPVETSFESELVERVDLDHAVEMLEPLLFLLARMIDQLLTRVLSHSRAIASLQVVLKLEREVDDGQAQTHQRVVRPALPLQDARTLLKLLQLDLETHPPKAAIVALELRAQSAKPHRAQHGLFLPQAPEPARLEVLLARLRKLLGDERVGSPELLDQHCSDAFRMIPFCPLAPKLKEEQSASPPAALRVCRPPQAIGVALNGTSPAQVYWNGQRYIVVKIAGPWRLSGQWWSELNWSREEWDVRLADGNRRQTCRIARDPHSKCWYMQGTYD
jgi:protein ImuB